MEQADTQAHDGRPSGVAELRRRLDDPATVQLMQDILDKLDVVHLSIATLDGVMRRAETLTENVTDGIQEARGTVDPQVLGSLASLVTLTPKLVAGLEKIAPALESDGLAQLADPAVVDTLGKLAQHTQLLVLAADAAGGFLARSETIMESVAVGMHEVRGITEGGAGEAIDILARLGGLMPSVQSLLDQVEPLIETGALEQLTQSKILAPEMIETMARLGDALHATRVAHNADPRRLGIFGLMRAMKDPDTQSTLGFLSTFLSEFGRRIR